MAIAQTHTNKQDAANSGNYNVDWTDFTVPSGTTLIVCVVGSKRNTQADQSPVSLTWDQTGTPQAMAEEIEAHADSTNRGGETTIWTLKNPTSGNHTLRLVKPFTQTIELTCTMYYITGEAAADYVGSVVVLEDNDTGTIFHTEMITTRANSLLLGGCVTWGDIDGTTLSNYDSTINDHTSSFGSDWRSDQKKGRKAATAIGGYGFGWTSVQAGRITFAAIEIREEDTSSDLAFESGMQLDLEQISGSSSTSRFIVGPAGTFLAVKVENHKVYVGAESDNATPTGITYNGVSLTKRAEGQQSTTNRNYSASIWTLDSPATGDNNLVITWADNANKFTSAAIAFVRENASPIGNIIELGDTGDNHPKSNITTTGANSIVLASCLQGGTGSNPVSLTPQSSTVEIFEDHYTGNDPKLAYAHGFKAVAAAGSTEVGWDADFKWYRNLALLEIKSEVSAGVTPDHIVNACINRTINRGIQSVPN